MFVNLWIISYLYYLNQLMLFSKLLKSIVNTFVSMLIVNYIMLKELLFLYLAVTSGSLSSLLYAFHKRNHICLKS